MKNMIAVAMTLTVLGALSARAEEVDGWSFQAGYVWRARAETDFGGAAAMMPVGGVYENGTLDGLGGWTGGTQVKLPTAGGGVGSAFDGNDWALRLSRSESVAAGGDEDSLHGFGIGAGYALWSDETFAVSAVARFAGYWGLKNSTSGGYCRYNDYARFALATGGTTTAPIVDPTDNVDAPLMADREYLAGGPGGCVTLRSDLYQIGLGPKVTWHVLSCLDVYAGVEALCTFANSELDAGGASTDEVNCLWGVGGHVGFTGWMTENIGFFGQVGYEWIDEDDVSVHGVRAETDYSSLVLSAGLQIRF